MDLVSIITPAFNSAKYIEETIISVLNQTYSNWEMIIVDDKSSDNLVPIVEKYCKKDSRIKLISLSENSGSATVPRNIALEEAKGRYIAFLDGDDIWLPAKLEEQIPLFSDDKTALVYSYYEKINEDGTKRDRIIKSKGVLNYRQLLHGNIIGCLTCIYDTKKVGKVFFENIGHEDYHTWLKILRMGYIAKSTETNLALYRVRKDSLSSNKFKVILWLWNIYYNKEKLGFFRSVFCLISNLTKAFYKSLK